MLKGDGQFREQCSIIAIWAYDVHVVPQILRGHILHMIILFVMYAPIVENAAAVGRMPMAVSTVGRNFIVARA